MDDVNKLHCFHCGAEITAKDIQVPLDQHIWPYSLHNDIKAKFTCAACRNNFATVSLPHNEESEGS